MLEDAPQSPETKPVDVSPKSSGRLSLLSSLIFLAGVAALAWGLYIMTRQTPPDFPPHQILDSWPIRNDLFGNAQALIIGLPIALVGALMAGAAARRALPDTLAGLTLPLPSLGLLRRDRITLAALVLAVICNARLYWDLAGKNYTHWDIGLFFVGLALVAFVVHRLDKSTRASSLRFNRFDLLAAIVLAMLAAVLYSIDLAGWQFTWVGDEGLFYDTAAGIAKGQISDWNFFRENYVYGMHPQFDSIYQTLGMHVFGVNIIGMRASEVLLMAASTAVMYPLGVALLGRLPALAACMVLASNHYLMAFARIGYNSNHPIFFGSLAMLMLVLAWRTQRAVFVFLTGVTVGLCLYTFRIALLMWPIMLLVLLVIFLRKPTRGMLLAGLLMLFGFLLAVIPSFLVTPLNEQYEVAATYSYVSKNPIDDMFVGLEASVVSFWDNHAWTSHFVGGPLMDPVSGVLLAVGVMTALFRINKRAERLMLIWFAGGVLLASVTSWGIEAHLTRMQVVMPGAALLVGLGLSKFETVLLSGLRLPAFVVGVLIMGPLLAMPPLNLNTLLIEGPNREVINSWVLMMKVIQEHPSSVVIEVGVLRDEGFTFTNLIQRYPWLAWRYRYSQYSSLEQPVPEGPAYQLPIYVIAVENEAILPYVKANLPGDYRLVDDREFNNRYRIWVFLPP